MDSVEETLAVLRLLVEYQAAAALELGQIAHQFKSETPPDVAGTNLAAIGRTQVFVAACLELLKSEEALNYPIPPAP
ncbi:hypothetical protein [Pseudomonas bohemica]|uniref:hypothetical protein n=1 Tax=Pseudomonas bohemica TaxID=2044872 RepID=UPI000DA63A4C|nr:hypothetical protein [Pseudomonas bohemica]